MTKVLRTRCAIACLLLAGIALATAYGQEALRRLPAVVAEGVSPTELDCKRLPQIDEPSLEVALADPRGELRSIRLPAVQDENLVAPEPRESLAIQPLPRPTESSPEVSHSEAPPLATPGNDSTPWWEPYTRGRLRAASTPSPVDVDSLVLRALRHSSQVRAISDNYLIQRTAITEAAAAFDVRTFMDTRFNRVNEPVGNTLTTGGPPRYLNDDFRASAGLRKKVTTGGSLEFSQRIGLQDSNSVFFVPGNQGNSRLSLSFSQPLLRGGGKAYNSSVTVLAEIDTRIAQDQTSQELQEHLLKVTRAYWELYLQRAVLLQRQRLYERGRLIQIELDGRRDIDALQNQLVRAAAAVSSRKAELVRAEASIKNAEARIRALVNAPEMLSDGRLELVPQEPPAREYINVDLTDARTTALSNRPEINQVLKQIQAANVRIDVSRNELRPVLDLVLESYITGLQGQFDIGQSLAQQFNQGAPSYTAGLVYELPWGNRAARARYERRQLEMRRLTEQLQALLQQLSAEVEVAVREVQTTYGEIQSKYQAMQALQTEMDYLTQRWQLLPGDDRSASFLLGDLLDVQEQLAREEFSFAKSQADYTLALAELKRVTGTLLQYERVEPIESEENGLPRLQFERVNKGEQIAPPLPIQPPLMETRGPNLQNPVITAGRPTNQLYRK